MNSAQPHLSLQNLILPRDSTHPLDLWKPKSLMILRVGKAAEQWKVSHTADGSVCWKTGGHFVEKLKACFLCKLKFPAKYTNSAETWVHWHQETV